MHCGKLEEYPFNKRKASRTSKFNQERSKKMKSVQLDKFVVSKKISCFGTYKDR